MVRQVRLVSPGTKIQVSPGDTVHVDVDFDYQGPAWRETLYSALYGYTWGQIDEVAGGAGASAIDIPYTPAPGIVRAYVLVPVPNRPGETFGIYAKLGNILSRYWDDAIEIVEEAPPPEELIYFGLALRNIPSYLQPITYWSLTWQGVEYGKWKAIDRGILLTDVKSTGSFLLTLLNQAVPRIDTITTEVYTLKSGMLYDYNVADGILTGSTP